jgi:hypothetical protein
MKATTLQTPRVRDVRHPQNGQWPLPLSATQPGPEPAQADINSCRNPRAPRVFAVKPPIAADSGVHCTVTRITANRGWTCQDACIGSEAAAALTTLLIGTRRTHHGKP